jgi:hypothetical protein
VRYITDCMNIRQRWRQTALHNKALVLIGVLTAFGTLFYTAAAIVQIRLFERSADESSRQTDKLIQAAQTQATAAQQIVAASERNAAAAQEFATNAGYINAGVGNAVTKLGIQAGQIETSRKSAEESSHKALQTTIDNFQNDQRAWVGIQSIVCECYMTEQPGSTQMNRGPVQVFMINTGKTPALRVVTRIGWKNATISDPVPNVRDSIGALHYLTDVSKSIPITPTTPDAVRRGIMQARINDSEMALPPNIPVPIEGTPNIGDVSFVGNTPELTQVFYIIGEITYFDVYSGTPMHHTTFCAVTGDQIPNGTKTPIPFHFCSKENTMD